MQVALHEIVGKESADTDAKHERMCMYICTDTRTHIYNYNMIYKWDVYTCACVRACMRVLLGSHGERDGGGKKWQGWGALF